MAATDTAEPLSPDDAERLTEFARACKAAARVVVLYPATHPAIQASLKRVADSASRLRNNRAVSMTVFPDALLLHGRPPVKADGSLGELAALLHAQLIGELTLRDDLTSAEWHTFLTLIARDPEQIREQGGIVRAWTTAGGGPIELRQIDYAEVLREREKGVEGDWDRIIAACIEGKISDLDEDAMAALLEIAADQIQLRDFIERLVNQTTLGGRVEKKDVVLQVLQALADFVAREHPDQLDRTLNHIAGVVPRLTPELVVTLLTTGVPKPPDAPPGIDLPGEVRDRISDKTVAEFVARSVSREGFATTRLAQAFQTLVPEQNRAHLLEMAQNEAENLPIGRNHQFRELWQNTVELLTSYSDSQFVSEEYGRELAAVRSQAIEVDRVSDDPPDRVNSWLASVSQQEVRRLDHQVLLDLLVIETRQEAWSKVLESALGSIQQLAASGQVVMAQSLLDTIIAASENGAPFAEAARAGLEQLRGGPLMQHVIAFTRQAIADDVKDISAFCRTIGPAAIRPLAEALAIEQGGAVKRLREIVLSFGAAGRAHANELRVSANPAARRTAVELLRSFGGADALPDLKALMRDSEPAVAREALRAIVQIGTPEAYKTVADAIKAGDSERRDSILRALTTARDERAAGLFVHVIDHTNPRGNMEPVYRLAIDALGQVGGDPQSVAALKRVLYRGEWWAPIRTARLRAAAAAALRASATPAAEQALEEAATSGPSGTRRAAKAALSTPAPRPQARRTE
jgi:hypothetical protein